MPQVRWQCQGANRWRGCCSCYRCCSEASYGGSSGRESPGDWRGYCEASGGEGYAPLYRRYPGGRSGGSGEEASQTGGGRWREVIACKGACEAYSHCTGRGNRQGGWTWRCDTQPWRGARWRAGCPSQPWCKSTIVVGRGGGGKAQSCYRYSFRWSSVHGGSAHDGINQQLRGGACCRAFTVYACCVVLSGGNRWCEDNDDHDSDVRWSHNPRRQRCVALSPKLFLSALRNTLSTLREVLRRRLTGGCGAGFVVQRLAGGSVEAPHLEAGLVGPRKLALA